MHTAGKSVTSYPARPDSAEGYTAVQIRPKGVVRPPRGPCGGIRPAWLCSAKQHHPARLALFCQNGTPKIGFVLPNRSPSSACQTVPKLNWLCSAKPHPQAAWLCSTKRDTAISLSFVRPKPVCSPQSVVRKPVFSSPASPTALHWTPALHRPR